MSEDRKVRRRKKKLGAYPSFSVVFSVTLALYVIGLLGLLLTHTHKLTDIIKENMEIQVYLNKKVTDAQKIKIEKTLATSGIVAKDLNNNLKIDFISKEDAAKEFIEETGEDFIAFLGENPLRDAFIINIDPDHQTEAEIKKFEGALNAVSGVFEVEYVKDLIGSINQNLAKITLILLGFAAILVIIVILLINNTIKLALFSQRFLIRSMQLVGAKGSFIRNPFLLRSMSHGLFGGIIASIALYATSEYAYLKIDRLQLLEDINIKMALFCVLVLLGILLCFSSTLKSINKYLKLSLDELY